MFYHQVRTSSFLQILKKRERERGGWEHSYIATPQSIVLQSRALELWKRGREDNSTFRNTTHSDYIPCPTSHLTDTGTTRLLSVFTCCVGGRNTLLILICWESYFYRWNQCSTRKKSVHDQRDKTRACYFSLLGLCVTHHDILIASELFWHMVVNPQVLLI